MNRTIYTILKWIFIGVFLLLNALLLFGVISMRATLVKIVYWGSVVAAEFFGQLSGQNISTERKAMGIIAILAFAVLLSTIVSIYIDK